MTRPTPPPPPPEAVGETTPPPPSAQPRPDYASLGARFGAVVLDMFIFYGLIVLAGLVVLPVHALYGPSAGDIVAGIVGLVAMIFAVFWQLLSLGRLGQTYGKHLTGVTVVRATDGSTIGGGSAFARSIVQTLGLYVLGLGWLWAIWDKRKQGWHDKTVRTVVLDAGGQKKVNPFTHIRAAFRGHW